MQRSMASNPIKAPILRLTLATSLLVASLVALGFTSPHGVNESQGSKGINSVLSKPLTFKNWGLINSEARSHISAIDAWKIEEGSRSVIVAVIDTGLDASHPALTANIWRDTKAEAAKPQLLELTPTTTSGVAQDKASVNKSVYGWNFVTDRANPSDEHGHGTHVAGIIGAVNDPKSGVSGVAHRVSIMAVKYYSDANTGQVNLKNTVRALNYAVEHGAKIVNYSGGGPEPSEEEYLALKKAEARGVLVVSAAGNEHHNTDLPEYNYFPAAYRLTNMISVASTDIRNNLLASSNWGKTKVDVAAPGENIFSTLPGGGYGRMSGTSQATAFVSGIAALLLSRDPTLTPQQIKEIIMASVDRFPQLANKLVTGGRVNAYSALLALRNKDQFKRNAPKRPMADQPTSFMDLVASLPGTAPGFEPLQ